MQYQISAGNIVLKPDMNNMQDLAYLREVNPYRLGHSGQYKLPLTKRSLIHYYKYFGINYFKIPTVLDTIIKLDIALAFNVFTTHKEPTHVLRPYQLQGVEWIKMRLQHATALGLFWAPRTGKTRTTCIASKSYKKIIVLTLAGQEANWESTYLDMCNRTCVNIHKKSPQMRQKLYKQFVGTTNNILIGSINTLTNDIVSGKLVLPKDIDLLVVDEIHKARNNKTRLHKGVKLLRNKANYCLGLTGTPVSKHINEMLPLFGLLLPQRFSKTYLSQYFFKQEFSEWSDYGVAGDLKEQKKAEWFEFMSLYFSQVTKEQALPWANEPLSQVIHLHMDNKQRKIYERCLFHFEVKKQNGDVIQIQEVIAQMTYLRQLITHPMLLEIEAPSAKEEWLFEFLEQDEPRDGIIIFTWHTSYLDLLYEKLKHKYKVCLITGETKNKTKVANDFQNGVYDIVLANIQAGSKGITLDRADTMVFLDEDWRPDENQQAVERFTATAPDRVKLRQVYRLEIADKFFDKDWNIEMFSMDKYIHDVVENKITKTELVENFKTIFEKLYNKN